MLDEVVLDELDVVGATVVVVLGGRVVLVVVVVSGPLETVIVTVEPGATAVPAAGF